MEEAKRQLRKIMTIRQQALDDAYVRAAGMDIEKQIIFSPAYQSARTIFLYVSMNKEPSTRGILDRALKDGKAVYVPKCLGDGEMLAVRISSMKDLVSGAFGILEPVDVSEKITASDLDLILVPCLAASADGRRLGHGKGYYDRFLAESSENTICLCFREMLREDIAVEDHDIWMSAVITEHSLLC